MIVDISCDIFGLWYTSICVCSHPCYVFMCVYVNMVCQRCMLYDDMYSHDKGNLGAQPNFLLFKEIILF
jgi:hypothetical protein